MKNEYKFSMGKAIEIFHALKDKLVSESVSNDCAGIMGAVNTQLWTSIIGGTLQYEVSNGGCTLRVIQSESDGEITTTEHDHHVNAVDGTYVAGGNGWCTWDELQKRSYLGTGKAIHVVGSNSEFCSKHPQTKRVVHPYIRTASMPSQPVYYCPECEPGVAEWEKKWGGK
ncbi:hypothetical protein OB912_15935 [Enterobacter kobei]|nr:hypothetical protein [Enterobacter kobei]